MDYTIEELRNQYFESVMLLTNEEDIIHALPQPGYDSFYPIMNGLISSIEKRINDLNGELSTILDDKELIELAMEEIKLLQFKKAVCQKIIEKANKSDDVIGPVVSNDKVNLVFATTEAGNVYVERDLKNIPLEYYDSIIGCLEKIEDGYDEKNPEKAKKLHYDLLGMHEIKDDDVRIYYKKLTPDIAYIVMFQIKKSDFGKSVHNEVLKRTKGIDNEFSKLKEMVKEPLKKERLININSEIRDRIFSVMNEKRRGRNV